MDRRVISILSVAVLLAGSLVAQTKEKQASTSAPSTNAKYGAAIEALQELDSASSVGLNVLQFSERVINVKIKVDKLGNDPRYKLIKETTRLLVDASILWNGSIAGSLPAGS